MSPRNTAADNNDAPGHRPEGSRSLNFALDIWIAGSLVWGNGRGAARPSNRRCHDDRKCLPDGTCTRPNRSLALITNAEMHGRQWRPVRRWVVRKTERGRRMPPLLACGRAQSREFLFQTHSGAQRGTGELVSGTESL